MNQTRQVEKDRERSKKYYIINLKEEFEIKLLHEKFVPQIIYTLSAGTMAGNKESTFRNNK